MIAHSIVSVDPSGNLVCVANDKNVSIVTAQHAQAQLHGYAASIAAPAPNHDLVHRPQEQPSIVCNTHPVAYSAVI